MATVSFDPDIRFTSADTGFYYAQKLVPEFEIIETSTANTIIMKIGLPKYLKLNPGMIGTFKKQFEEEEPINAYEEIKQRNAKLNHLSTEKDEELRRSKLVNEKKTEFISIASHELKTPITVLKAYTQMAKSTKETISSNLLELLSKIDLQSNKLLTLVQQLLDISKIENGNLQYHMLNVRLNGFLTKQVAVMQHILPHHEFVTNYCDELTVLIDELRMEQVLANLLGNAGKYSDKHTRILVETEMSDNKQVTIRISDQGRGMTKETMTSIFEKFYRAKDVLKSHTGLGMGLYITSKIVTDHKGKIWVESEEGVGSSFCFTVPLAF